MERVSEVTNTTEGILCDMVAKTAKLVEWGDLEIDFTTSDDSGEFFSDEYETADGEIVAPYDFVGLEAFLDEKGLSPSEELKKFICEYNINVKLYWTNDNVIIAVW